MSYVFLSYSHKDEEMMREIKEELTDEGIEVWSDDELEWGTPSWERDVKDAIRGAAAMVVLLSPNANDSIWVGRELSMAELLNIKIYPILIAGTEEQSLPLRLVNHQYLRYDDEDFLEELKKLRSKLRRNITMAKSSQEEKVPLREAETELQAEKYTERYGAVQDLVRLNDDRAVPHLIEALRSGELSVTVLIALIQALAVYRDPRAIEVLAKYVHDERSLKGSNPVRDYARFALESIGTPEAVAALENGSGDSSA